jgi:hypothetical protein
MHTLNIPSYLLYKFPPHSTFTGPRAISPPAIYLPTLRRCLLAAFNWVHHPDRLLAQQEPCRHAQSSTSLSKGSCFEFHDRLLFCAAHQCVLVFCWIYNYTYHLFYVRFLLLTSLGSVHRFLKFTPSVFSLMPFGWLRCVTLTHTCSYYFFVGLSFSIYVYNFRNICKALNKHGTMSTKFRCEKVRSRWVVSLQETSWAAWVPSASSHCFLKMSFNIINPSSTVINDLFHWGF